MEKSVKTGKKDVKRLQILDGAVKAFCERGIRNATITDICEKVGCSHGLFYHYYVNKEELLKDLVKKWDFEFLRYAYDVMKRDISPIKKVREIINYTFVSCKENEMYSYRFFLFTAEAFRLKSAKIDFKSIGDNLTPMFDSMPEMNEFSRLFTELFTEAKDKGMLLKDCSVNEYWQLLTALMTGYSMQYVLCPQELKGKIALPNADLILSTMFNKEAIENDEKTVE